jgi:hypothetical protein
MQSDAGLSVSRLASVGVLVEKLALGQVFLQVLLFSGVRSVPPVLSINILFTYNRRHVMFVMDSVVNP